MTAPPVTDPTSERPPEDQSDARHTTPLAGDGRWPGPSRDELLGQRARHRSTGELDDRAISIGGGDVGVPELPVLEDDVYLLEPDAMDSRSRRRTVLGTLHALALDTALAAGGDVVWIDTQGHATTRSLARIAPSERAFERVHVARAFTTHQHRTLVDQVGRWLRDGVDGPFGSPATDRPAVLVCPAVDALYRGGELPAGESQSLMMRVLAVAMGIARSHDIPVILTRTRADDYAVPVQRTATTIEVERTRFGPRFECEPLDFETLVYPVEDGLVQTTFAFWREILATRHETVASATDQPATGPTVTSTLEGG
jgi:hypothetical protein